MLNDSSDITPAPLESGGASISLHNFLVLFFSQGFGKLTGLIFGFAAARLLGSAGFGDYAALNAFLCYALIVTDFGLSSLLVREMSQQTGQRPQILASGLVLRFALSGAAFLCILAAGILLHVSWLFFFCLLMGGLGAILYAWNSTLTDLLVSREKLRNAALLDMACQIIFLGSVVLLLFATRSILGIFISLLAANGVRALVLSALCRPEIKAIRWSQWDKASCGNLLKQAYYFGLLGVMGMLYLKINILLLYTFHPGSPVGWFEGAFRLLEAAMIFPVSMMTALYPLFSRLAGSPSSSIHLHQIFVRTTKFLFWGGLFFALFIGCAAKPLILFCYGREFLRAVPIVSILMAGLVLLHITAPFSRILLAAGHHKKVVQLYVPVLAGTILLNLLLIPPWGIYGAAAAVVISEAVCIAFFYPAAAKHAGPLPWKEIASKPLICAALFALTYLVFHGSPWLALGTASAAFFLGTVLCRIFDTEDIAVIREAFARLLGKT